jgi:hypothetical protein
MIDFFCRWLRAFFDVDESRLRVNLYLHGVSTSILLWRSGWM